MDADTVLSKMTRSIIEGDRERAETLARDAVARGLDLNAVIEQRDEDLALPLFEGFSAGTQFLTMPHTRRWYREEHIFPDIIDRDTYDAWVSAGEKDIGQRAADRLEELLRQSPPNRVEPELQGRFRAIMQADAEENGIDALPGLD
jgi:trimethylamine--corrinoid protein Co-methyltransferase